jgi:hypothetical protein
MVVVHRGSRGFPLPRSVMRWGLLMGWKSKYRRRQWWLRNERLVSRAQTALLAVAAVATVLFIALNLHR